MLRRDRDLFVVIVEEKESYACKSGCTQQGSKQREAGAFAFNHRLDGCGVVSDRCGCGCRRRQRQYATILALTYPNRALHCREPDSRGCLSRC